MNGGSKLEPRSVECRLLGYATGTDNYKVQDVTTRWTFVSHDLVFEEGQPCCMLSGVGEQATTQINIFDVDLTNPPTNNSEPGNISDSTIGDHQDHQDHQVQNTIPIIEINDQRQST